MSSSKYLRCVEDALESIEYADLNSRGLAFRGQCNCEWPITPSIARGNDGTLLDHSLAAKKELVCFHSLVRRKKSFFSRSYHPVEHLMQLQHHGFPTRLIDWTTDIMVGLFFACWDPKGAHRDKHGSLHILLMDELQFFDPFRAKDDVKWQTFDQEAIKNEVIRLRQSNDVLLLEPFVKNPRMRVQHGVFTLSPIFGHKDGKCISFSKAMYHLGKPIMGKQVHVDHKAGILKQLQEQYGISESTIMINNDIILGIEKDLLLDLNEGMKYISKLLNVDFTGDKLNPKDPPEGDRPSEEQ